MNLSQGPRALSIPGPSMIPERVLGAMHRPAVNIYDPVLMEEFNAIRQDLCAVARTRQNLAVYMGNGHAVWEAVNVNMFSRGDRALSLVTGHFGIGWASHARDLGIEVEMLDFGRKGGVDADQVEAALRADTGHTIRAVLLTQAETATSALNDVQAVRKAIDAAGHPALLAVDCVASMGCDRFEFDAWGVDVAVAASQKGLMMPPGLGFVWVSDKALAACKGSDLRTPYWDWTMRVGATEYWQNFGGTPATHHVFAMREALKMIVHEEGIEAVWARHDRLARAVWAAFDAWGQDCPNIGMVIADPAQRSRAVTCAHITAPMATRLREWCESQAGVTLGVGLGFAAPTDPAWHGWLRVGHMGHVNAHLVLGTLGAMEAGLIALDIPHGGSGLAAAARVIAGR